MNAKTNPPTPEVIIVGAGLSGLLLGILLDRAKIPFNIYERAPHVKPLGAIMSLNVNILPALEQLGLMDELEKIWFPSPGFNIYSHDMNLIASTGAEDYKDNVGYDVVVFARPPLYDILLSKIPADRIHFNKKVVSMEQDSMKVSVTCTDGTFVQGDILVGADGAYSNVRQSMYMQAEEAGVLPKADTEDLSQGYITMVGTTDPLLLSRYPDLKDNYTHFAQMIGKKGSPYTWSTFTVPDRKICWSVQLQLGGKSMEEMFKNSEWTPDSDDKMIQEIYDFKTPYGILGDLIDATPKERISKVALEDKMFETWHYGRCVLIGDGAVNALQDSVILANCIYDLPSLATKDITAAFKDYREQRRSFVDHQFKASKMQAKVLFGQSVKMKDVYKSATYRPQASFLPLVEKRGKCDVIPQKLSKRYVEEQRKAAEENA
ncbi:hypothetical protein BGZ58_006977 [Dissophora ornata]|nr:hypothetical protein BGZ58_006977 [Dissophora ornata]